MKMFSNGKPTKRKHVAVPASNGSTNEDNEDETISKRKMRFFANFTPSTTVKKPANQPESQSKRTPIIFNSNNGSSSIPRPQIKINFSTKNLGTPSFTSQASSTPRSSVVNQTPDVVNNRSLVADKGAPASKSNLRINYDSEGDDDAAAQTSVIKPSTGFRLSSTLTLPKQVPPSKSLTTSAPPRNTVTNQLAAIRQILTAKKTPPRTKSNNGVPSASTQSSKQHSAITFDGQKESTFFPSSKRRLSESKSATPDEAKTEFFPSKKRLDSKTSDEAKTEFFPSKKRRDSKTPEEAKTEFFPSKKSRSSETKRTPITFEEEAKTEFFPSKDRRSSGAKRTPITFEEDSKKEPEFFPSKKSRSSETKRTSITIEETPKSETKHHSLLTHKSSNDDARSKRESFFNSPATPHPYKSKFKNPPVYKGQDGRFYVAFFTNKYIFSNHFVCPSGVTVDDMEFPTTEHYYMYSKALFHDDASAAKRIQKASDPKEAKRITAKFENFDTNGWKKLQYKVMEKACLAKFRQNPDLRRELFRTCNAVLVEASPSDQRWGVGLSMDNPDVADEDRWRGSNLLGNLLMNVRAKLATEYEEEFENELEDGQRDLKRRAIKC